MYKKRTDKIEKSEFDQKVLEIKRVTRVVKGGKRMSFRAAVILGDKKHFISVPISNGTIPHEIKGKFKASKVLLKPAVKGRGVIAGGAVRSVIILSGITDITAKTLGTSTNQVNNAKATLEAFKGLKRV